MQKRGFALSELLITLTVIAIILTVLYSVTKPEELLQKSRDSRRFSDINSLVGAVNAYLAQNYNFQDLKGPYFSNDPNFSSDDARKKADGSGWIPIDFEQIKTAANSVQLPIDPKNNADFHYSFAISKNPDTFEFDCAFENPENFSKAQNDGGNNDNLYEIGTDLHLLN